MIDDVCSCEGDVRKDGFTGEWRDGKLWFVHSRCRKPKAAWLEAMKKVWKEENCEQMDS